jgi:oxygen-dependent protoporphyrinogen oxidase
MIDALVTQLTAAGAELRLNSAVAALSPTAGATEVRFADGATETFDAVIFAAGARASAALLADSAPAAAAALSDIPLATSTVLALAYPATAFATPVTTHGWLEADPAPISGITVSSAKWAGRAPDDVVLIRAFVPGRLGPIADADDDELVAAVSAHVGEVLGATTPPTQVRVARWPHVMPKYTVGHRDRVAAVETALAALPQWRVAGSPLRGVGVPDCVADGRRQAALALAAACDLADHRGADNRVFNQGSRQ